MEGKISKPEYRLFHTSTENIEGLIGMIKKAKHSIDIETFYFYPDTVGRRILDLLLEKAKAGVTIRLLADSMGSISLIQSLYIDAFRHAGAYIHFFNSIIPFSKTQKTIWFFRNHRRTVIVDDNELFVGSICIGEQTVDWIETGIAIKNSESVMQAKKAFNMTWHKSFHKTFKIGVSSKFSTDSFSYITQAPLQSQRHIYKILIDHIRNAKNNITLVAPYIVPDRRIMRALRHARRRKVEINIITSKETDNNFADLARNTYISQMLTFGMSVYLSPKMIHSKLAIIDNELALIGTMNLDNVSLRYNYECTIATDNKDCIDELSKVIEKDMINSSKKLHHMEWDNRSYWIQFLEILIWPIRKLF